MKINLLSSFIFDFLISSIVILSKSSPIDAGILIFMTYEALLNRLKKLLLVIAEKSLYSRLNIFDTYSTVWVIYAGSFALPLTGTGAR